MSNAPAPPSVPPAPPVTRFAPSPTGYLHLGHAYSARYAYTLAREAFGRCLLRIEDIDSTRCRPEFTTALIDDLGYLGLRFDGPLRTQSQHLPQYSQLLDQLSADGLLYPCFCTRAEIAAEAAAAGGAPHDLPLPGRQPDSLPPPQVGTLYPGTCRRLAAPEAAARLARGSSYSLRLDSARALAQAEARAGGPLHFFDRRFGQVAVTLAHLGDVVLGRKEIRASYHLAVTHDDMLQGVTLVSRGEDLFHATHLHRVLQVLFGWPEPTYAHHPLLTDAGGDRLAKRRGSPSLRSLRQAGLSPTDIWALAGLPPLT